MPSAARTGELLRRREPGPVVLHTAPMVLPIADEPIGDGAVAVRGDRVLQVGKRSALRAGYPGSREMRWPGTIVAGLVDPFATGDAPGVTTRAGLGESCDVIYVEVRCADAQAWEERERDALITAIREADRPVGVAAHSPDPEVLEDLAVLARTFGLRLVADLAVTAPGPLDEAGVLGPLCHVACSGQLDPGERKLLLLRQSVIAFSPGGDALALLDDGEPFALAGDPLGHAAALSRRRPTQAERLVRAATLGGAAALGRDRGPGRIGSLGPGSRADLAVFQVRDTRGRHPYSALLDHAPCLARVVAGRVERRAERAVDALARDHGHRTPDRRGADRVYGEAEAGGIDPGR
ncbi:imidazolonepropionase-like domain-containing protein [Nonomuraea soli]|uniref:Aminodeoxyfutalosine deaminase/Imidazolonepropionase-like composite domain-containing protein n=1 Tax=Nonomuraea soli TaxID=1032476 RepID=A0A7W0CSH1_9ACTN|nr:hypothetical protein [Nonomuraea soli]MBA2896524.1 hypothetical protein [Nonomuraea soli]